MDLRRRLVGMLGLLLAGLLAMTAVVQWYSLRADVEAEVAASTRLVQLLVAADQQPLTDAAALEALLAQAQLRHLRLRTAGATAVSTASSLPDWLASLLPRLIPTLAPALAPALVPHAPLEQQVRIGHQTLLIAPNPASEIQERLADTVRLWSTLLFFSGTTLLVAWWCADHALRPVRALEASLHRLARGEPDPALPPFALREFGRVARAIDYLARALAEARAAQQALARQLITLQEDEKRALARELHDEMGQTLTSLNVTAAHLERNAAHLTPQSVVECSADLRRDLRTCSQQLRGLLKNLRPHGLSADGLQQALSDLVASWRSRQTAISFELALAHDLPPVDEARALVIYRVVQEALTNVVRHSGAVCCELSLSARATALQLDVMDDGCGLPSDLHWQGGLLGMQERIGMIGGQLQVLHGVAGGLHLRALIPLPQTAPSSLADVAGVLA